jgi:hypothetical protein
MIWENTLPLFWNLHQGCGITYLVCEQAHIPLVLFGFCNLEISRSSRGLPVAKCVLLPLKGQELTQPDVTFKHSFYSEILAAWSFPREEFSLWSRGRSSQTMRTHVLYEIFLHSGSYNSPNVDGINNEGNLHINVPQLIKILLTVSFFKSKCSVSWFTVHYSESLRLLETGRKTCPFLDIKHTSIVVNLGSTK